MYNLLVSSDEDAWNKNSYLFDEMSRCIREYTDDAVIEKYGQFTKPQIEAIKNFPCIFAYENGCKKDPKFGKIHDIKEKKGQVKIQYEILELENFLKYTDITSMLFELDIYQWEMNRTHWAIKGVDLSKELSLKGIYLPQWADNKTGIIDITKHHFDVALSFAGENREYVKDVADHLSNMIGIHSYFYDSNYVAQLARPSLDNLLQDIYRNRSKLVVVFLCGDYEKKEWCGIEFRAIKEIIMEKQHEKIMFIKIGDGEVQGVFKIDGYIDGMNFTPNEVAEFIKERIDVASH